MLLLDRKVHHIHHKLWHKVTSLLIELLFSTLFPTDNVHLNESCSIEHNSLYIRILFIKTKEKSSKLD